MGMLLVRYMPVIKEIVMKKCSSDQFSAIAGNMQPVADNKTAPCHTKHMLINRHAAMLDILFCSAKISGS